MGAVHAVPGVPAGVAAGDLHDELDRVAELPAAQGHQEPRALPQRRRRREAAVAGDLQHRRQTSPRTRQGTRPTRQTTQSTRPARRRPGHHELETSPRATRPRLPRPHQPPPLTTPTTAAYTDNLTRSHRAPGTPASGSAVGRQLRPSCRAARPPSWRRSVVCWVSSRSDRVRAVDLDSALAAPRYGPVMRHHYLLAQASSLGARVRAARLPNPDTAMGHRPCERSVGAVRLRVRAGDESSSRSSCSRPAR